MKPGLHSWHAPISPLPERSFSVPEGQAAAVAFVLPAIWHIYDTDGHGGGLFKEPHMHHEL